MCCMWWIRCFPTPVIDWNRLKWSYSEAFHRFRGSHTSSAALKAHQTRFEPYWSPLWIYLINPVVGFGTMKIHRWSIKIIFEIWKFIKSFRGHRLELQNTLSKTRKRKFALKNGIWKSRDAKWALYRDSRWTELEIWLQATDVCEIK